MSVYKRTVRGKKQRHYSIDYVDEHGVRRTVSSKTSDKRMAQQLERKLNDRVRAIQEGLIDPVRDRMVAEARRPLAEHVADYLSACEARGEALSGFREKARHLAWLTEKHRGRPLNALRADEFDRWLGALTQEGASARTVNIKFECARALLNWCCKNGRLERNPLVVISRRNETLDRRRIRRALSEDEVNRLLSHVRQLGFRDPAARHRYLWYLLPLRAGLRRRELMDLRWGDFDLAAVPPTLTVRGGKAKKRVDQLPVDPAVASEVVRLRPRKALPTALVFPSPVSNATRQRDFVAAGVELETDAGHADLHALRHTFGTELAKRGVMPATLKSLMRHSTVELTMRFYVHLDVTALGEGLAALPRLSEEASPGSAGQVG